MTRRYSALDAQRVRDNQRTVDRMRQQGPGRRTAFQTEVLNALGRIGPCTAADIADDIDETTARVSRALGALRSRREADMARDGSVGRWEAR